MSVVLAMMLCFQGVPECETVIARPTPGMTECLSQAKVMARQLRTPSNGQKLWLKTLIGPNRKLARGRVECRWQMET